MSEEVLCRLCIRHCKDQKSLYRDDGRESDAYELMVKYFDPKCLSRDAGYNLTSMCLECWSKMCSFNDFQRCVYEAQRTLHSRCNNVQIKSEIELPGQEVDTYTTHQEVCVKIESGAPQDALSKSNNFGGFTITEMDEAVDTKSAKTQTQIKSEGANPTPDMGKCDADDVVAEVDATIALPKIELTDVYSGNDSSDDYDDFSDEYDDPDYVYLSGEMSERDDSGDHATQTENGDPLSTKNYQVRNGSAESLKGSDEFIAQWKPRLECELCSEICLTYSQLRLHFHDKHPLEKCFVTCCQQMYYRRYRIEDHIRRHMDPNAFKCELCDKDHTSRYYLLSHMRTAHSKSIGGIGRTWKKTRISDKEMDELIAQWMPNLECVVCKATCPSFKLLQLHFRQEHPQKQFQIECCQRKFKRRYEIEEHVRLHIDPNAFKCQLCYKQFKEGRYLLAHMRGFHSKANESKRKNAYQKKMEDAEMDELLAHDDFPDEAKSFLECVLCSERSTTYSMLRQHFQSNHPQEKFYILCCQQKLSLRYRIEDHVRLHIDPNTFKCDMCDKQFKEGRYLLAHKRSYHTDSNEESKKSSSSKKARTEKEIDDLVAQWLPILECVVCKMSSNTLTHLQLHFRESHPQKQFQIECCQRMFKRRYEIEEHIRLHINPDAFRCEICSTRFSMRRNLLKHMSSKHPSSDRT